MVAISEEITGDGALEGDFSFVVSPVSGGELEFSGSVVGVVKVVDAGAVAPPGVVPVVERWEVGEVEKGAHGNPGVGKVAQFGAPNFACFDGGASAGSLRH